MSDDQPKPSPSSSPAPPIAEMAPISRDSRPMIVGGEHPEKPFPLQLAGTVTRGFGRGARFLGIPTANLPDSSLGPLNDLHLTGIYYGFARIHPSSNTPLPTTLNTPSASGTVTPTRLASTDTDTSERHPHIPRDALSSPLSPDVIASLPARTAPYPQNSVPLNEGETALEGEIPDGSGDDGKSGKRKRLSNEDGKVWPMVMSVGWNPYFKNEKITAEVHIVHQFSNDFYGHDMSVLVLGYIRPELNYISREALIDDINTDVKVALNSMSREGYVKYASDPFLTGPTRASD